MKAANMKKLRISLSDILLSLFGIFFVLLSYIKDILFATKITNKN